MILNKEESQKQILNHLKKLSMTQIKKVMYRDKGQECHYH